MVYRVALITLLLLMGLGATAMDTTATRRSLVFTLGAGGVFHPGAPGVPAHLTTRVQRLGPGFTACLMWRPEHRLSLGVESGWTNVYTYSIEGPGERGSLQLSAIPLLLQWSMRITPRLDVYAGWGTYRLTSALDYLGTVRSALYSQGYVAAVSYRFPFGERFDGAVELKWMNAFVTQHHLIAVQWRLDWRFLQW